MPRTILSTSPQALLSALLALVFLNTLAPQVGAFTTAQFPWCALSCATNAALLVQCKQTNTTCLCATPAFTQSVVTCTSMGGGCSAADQPSVLAELASICPDLPAPTLPTTAALLAPSTSPALSTVKTTSTISTASATAEGAEAPKSSASVVSGAQLGIGSPRVGVLVGVINALVVVVVFCGMGLGGVV